jgi:hypothetical protein
MYREDREFPALRQAGILINGSKIFEIEFEAK